ncbi:MAG: hypothetical protein QM679_02885 [Patulibacter sp.]
MLLRGIDPHRALTTASRAELRVLEAAAERATEHRTGELDYLAAQIARHLAG